MKHLVSNTVILSIYACIMTLFSGCEQEPQYKEYVYPMPEITKMYPEVGYPGQRVTITGTNFGEWIQALKMSFGGVDASNVLSCKNNCIVVEVPNGAVSGEVALQTWNNPAVKVGSYKVYPTPVLTKIESDNEAGANMATTGDLVTLTGSNFGDDQSLVEVRFNGIVASMESFTSEKIVVRTPEYTSGLVTLTIRPEANGDPLVLVGTGLMDPDARGDVTAIFLKNSVAPFSPNGNINQWVRPDGWLFNSEFNGSSLTFTNDYPDGLIALQCGWGQSGKKQNAKMYQTATFPKGEYEFELDFVEVNKQSGRFGVYFAIAEGEGENAIPNLVEDNREGTGKKWYLETDVVGSYGINGSMNPHKKTLAVKLEQTTRLTIGFVTQLNNTGCVKVSYIKIIRK